MQHEELKRRLRAIFEREAPPQAEDYREILDKVNGVLDEEDTTYRPRSSTGRPGGLVYLRADLPAVIVPDLHARMDFLLHVLQFRYDGSRTVMQGLASGKLQVLCVGDGFHAEGRAANRWKAAFVEFRADYADHRQMDEEMRESLGLMET